MSILIGERKTRFWRGEKYVFERVAKGGLVCVFQDSIIIPTQIIASLGD